MHAHCTRYKKHALYSSHSFKVLKLKGCWTDSTPLIAGLVSTMNLILHILETVVQLYEKPSKLAT